jgi:4-amino-4-deoxy-L-arabinose transferase
LLVLARAVPAFVDVPVDDRALAAALMSELPAKPNEVAFVEGDPRYGLRFYLGSEVERLGLPGDAPKAQAQDIPSEMLEREGCRVLLVNEWNWGRLHEVLSHSDVVYKRLADVRGYIVIAQKTPDCPAYDAL